MKEIKQAFFLYCLLLCVVFSHTNAQSITFTLQLDKPFHDVSPILYGLMTEEINYSYDGGLYAETIHNRTFQDDPRIPVHWSLIKDESSDGSISLDWRQPLNQSLPVSLKLNADKIGDRIGVANDGYWGFPVRPNTSYKGAFYVKAKSGKHNFTVSIESKDRTKVYAKNDVIGVGTEWKKYTFILSTLSGIDTTSDALFVISTKDTGIYWFNLISLFPPTYNNTPNGNRPDIMQLLTDMKPTFLRLPGGNYLEGDYFYERFDWKKTLGGLENRPGHRSPWNYRSSDGMGLLEYLEWCEDLHIEPVLAVFAGYTLKGDHLEGKLLEPFIDEALEEIEYVTGDANTMWGAQRVKDGHPAPFPLRYVEIGNEDWFDRSGSYAQRFTQFYKSIKAKYPQLHLISTVDINGLKSYAKRHGIDVAMPDVVDEHYYRNAFEMESDAAHYDDYKRNGTKVFVGEWATREGSPTTNFNAALGDAAWMTGMERNSDVVVMASYAPLFVNINPGGMQWRSDLIGYDILNSYGSPSYYVQKMFGNYLGDKVIDIRGENVPLQLEKLSAEDLAEGKRPKEIPALFYVATKDSKKGLIYLKVVNTQGVTQTVNIKTNGVDIIASKAREIMIKADNPDETNSISEPKKIVPVASEISKVGKNFTHVFPPYSVTVLQLQLK